MTNEQANTIIGILTIIESGVITLLIMKTAKYTIKLVNYIRKKIKEN